MSMVIPIAAAISWLLTSLFIGIGFFGCAGKKKSATSKDDKLLHAATDTPRKPPTRQTMSSKPKLATTPEASNASKPGLPCSAATSPAQTGPGVSTDKKDEPKDSKQSKQDDKEKKKDEIPEEKPNKEAGGHSEGKKPSKKEDKPEGDDKPDEKKESKKDGGDGDKKDEGATGGTGDPAATGGESKEGGKKIMPRVIKRDAKAQRIAEGKEKRGKGDYPTMDDVLSDWDSEKEKEKEKKKAAAAAADAEPKTKKADVSKMQPTNLDDPTKEQDCIGGSAEKKSKKDEQAADDKKHASEKKEEAPPDGTSKKDEEEKKEE